MNYELVWKELKRAQIRVHELEAKLMAFIADKVAIGKSLKDARAAVLDNYSLTGRLHAKINSDPDKTWTLCDLAKAVNVDAANVRDPLSRLATRGLISRPARGKYKARTVRDEESMPTFTDNGINPSSIRGRMFDLLYANPKRCFTCEEVAKTLRCETNAARQAAYVLTKDQMIIRQKHGEYRAVTDDDMGGVRF